MDRETAKLAYICGIKTEGAVPINTAKFGVLLSEHVGFQELGELLSNIMQAVDAVQEIHAKANIASFAKYRAEIQQFTTSKSNKGEFDPADPKIDEYNSILNKRLIRLEDIKNQSRFNRALYGYILHDEGKRMTPILQELDDTEKSILLSISQYLALCSNDKLYWTELGFCDFFYKLRDTHYSKGIKWSVNYPTPEQHINHLQFGDFDLLGNPDETAHKVDNLLRNREYERDLSYEQDYKKNIANNNYELHNYYYCQSIVELCLASVLELIRQGRSFVKCQHCGRYFTPSRPNEIYCNHLSPYSERGATCKTFMKGQREIVNLRDKDNSALWKKVYMKKRNRMTRHPENEVYKNDYESFKAESDERLKQVVDEETEAAYAAWLRAKNEE